MDREIVFVSMLLGKLIILLSLGYFTLMFTPFVQFLLFGFGCLERRSLMMLGLRAQYLVVGHMTASLVSCVFEYPLGTR